MKNYYQILNLPNYAESLEIEYAYGLFLQRRYNTPNFYEIWDAYSVLSDPASKLSYDIALRMWLKEQPDPVVARQRCPMPEKPVAATPMPDAPKSSPVPIFRLFQFKLMFITFGVLLYLHNDNSASSRFYVPAQTSSDPVNITYSKPAAPATLPFHEAGIFPTPGGVDTGDHTFALAK